VWSGKHDSADIGVLRSFIPPVLLDSVSISHSELAETFVHGEIGKLEYLVGHNGNDEVLMW
jgi:hypothetical protein